MSGGTSVRPLWRTTTFSPRKVRRGKIETERLLQLHRTAEAFTDRCDETPMDRPGSVTGSVNTRATSTAVIASPTGLSRLRGMLIVVCDTRLAASRAA